MSETLNQQTKERIWKKLTEVSDYMDKANEQIHDLKDSLRRGEISNYSNLNRLKTALESTLLELENVGS